MRIGFIGGGNMAFALVAGLVDSGAIDLVVSDPKTEALSRFQSLSSQIVVTQDNNEVFANCTVIILAVKPQVMQVVCKQLAGIKNQSHRLFPRLF